MNFEADFIIPSSELQHFVANTVSFNVIKMIVLQSIRQYVHVLTLGLSDPLLVSKVDLVGRKWYFCSAQSTTGRGDFVAVDWKFE